MTVVFGLGLVISKTLLDKTGAIFWGYRANS
jgi:hypothetical protein